MRVSRPRREHFFRFSRRWRQISVGLFSDIVINISLYYNRGVMISTTLLATSLFITENLDRAKELSRYYQMPMVLFSDESDLGFDSKGFIFVKVEGMKGLTIVNPEGNVVARTHSDQSVHELKKFYTEVICHE